jgi:hypothetical protein
MTRVRDFLNRHIRVSRPAAETTTLMVGAAFLVFLLLIALGQNWIWVERASWVIALVLFPAAIYQLVVLQRDQRRLADELTKKPDVRVGLRTQEPGGPPGIDPNLKIAVHWQPDTPMSDVVKLPLSAVNVGSLTAHNVLVNVTFPKQVEFVMGPPQSQIRDEPEYDRWRLIFGEHATLHIGVTIDFTVSVRIANVLKNGFPLVAHVSTENAPYLTLALFVGYEH